MIDDDREMTAAFCYDLPTVIAAAKEWQREEDLNAAISEIRGGGLTSDSLSRHGVPEPVIGPARGSWSLGALPSGIGAEVTSGSTTYRCPARPPAHPCSLRGITRDSKTGTVPYCNLHDAYMENETDEAP